MINVFRDVLRSVENNGLKNGHHLYITFKTESKEVIMSDWLKDKFPTQMTIVMQYEYWNFKVYKEYFKITLSFNYIKSDLIIPFNCVISFADPYANFGLKLINDNKQIKKSKKIDKKLNQDNIIEFNKFKKN